MKKTWGKKKKHRMRITNTYFEFRVDIFSNNRDITKCQSFLRDDAKAIAIPRGLAENSRAKNLENALFPARWHDKHTYLSSLGMLGTTQLNSIFLQIT